MFHIFHSYKKVKTIKCSFWVSNLFSRSVKANGITVLEKCGCGKSRAYITEGTMRQNIDLNYIESILGKEWLEE